MPVKHNKKWFEDHTPNDIKTEYGSWAAAMRYMSKELGMSNSEIANALQKRYQHVRNVLIAPPPKAEQEATSDE